MRILWPDARFNDGTEIERRMAGLDAEFDIHNESDPDAIPASSWSAADVVMVYNTMKIDRRVAERLKRARILIRIGVGYDKIDLKAFGELGIPVCNTPDYGTTEVADTAIAMLLSLSRGIVTYDEMLRQDPHANWTFRTAPAVRRLRHRNFGVVGLGRIGTAAARRARAFDMRVGFYDPYLPNGTELAHNFTRYRSLNELLAASDAVSIHAPLNDETRGMIDAKAIAAMKQDAVLVNTARGPICDLKAIHDGLKSGKLGAVGLDVLPDEPPSLDEPLIRAWRAGEPWIKGRLHISPHAAFYSADAFADMRRLSMETAVLYTRDGKLQNCVNGEWLKTRRNWKE
jgi:lactate dehydrogenase-like 2-hydroxyacid dehydrogenase